MVRRRVLDVNNNMIEQVVEPKKVIKETPKVVESLGLENKQLPVVSKKEELEILSLSELRGLAVTEKVKFPKNIGKAKIIDKLLEFYSEPEL